MRSANLLVYGTLMDPEKLKEIERVFSYRDFTLVTLHGKRYFGAVDISAGIAATFLPDGDLISKDVASLTVTKKSKDRYNALIYNGVSSSLISKLSEKEQKLGFRITKVSEGCNVGGLQSFENGTSLEEKYSRFGNIPVMFQACEWIEIPEGKFKKTSFKHIREDISPNQKSLQGVKKAARVHGTAFENAFLETTLYADRETPLTKADPLKAK